MDNNDNPTVKEDPNVKLIRELRAEIERLRNSIGDTSNEDNTNDLKALKALADKEAQERHLTDEWTEKWKEAAKILDDHKALALKQTGKEFEFFHTIYRKMRQIKFFCF